MKVETSSCCLFRMIINSRREHHNHQRFYLRHQPVSWLVFLLAPLRKKSFLRTLRDSMTKAFKSESCCFCTNIRKLLVAQGQRVREKMRRGKSPRRTKFNEGGNGRNEDWSCFMCSTKCDISHKLFTSQLTPAGWGDFPLFFSAAVMGFFHSFKYTSRAKRLGDNSYTWYSCEPTIRLGTDTKSMKLKIR